MKRDWKLLFAILLIVVAWLAAIVFVRVMATPGSPSGLSHWILEYFLLPILALKMFKLIIVFAGLTFLISFGATFLSTDYFFAQAIIQWHGHLLSKGDHDLSKNDFDSALQYYLQATRINERFVRKHDLRLCDLNRLCRLYEVTHDQKSYEDVKNRILALQFEENRMPQFSQQNWHGNIIPQLLSQLKRKFLIKASMLIGVSTLIALVSAIIWTKGVSVFLVAIVVSALAGAVLAILRGLAARIDFLSTRLWSLLWDH